MNYIKKFVFPLLIIIYLFIGINIYKDYGISCDEPISRHNGLVNYKYIINTFAPSLLSPLLNNIPNLHDWMDKDYGVLFDLSALVLEIALNLQDTKDIFEFRHLLTFILSIFGVLALYSTAKNIYQDYKYGILAALILILSPRFFAESFYNSKDILFLTAIAISVYTLTKYINKNNYIWLIAHSIATAIAINFRLIGLITVLTSVLSIAYVHYYYKQQIKRSLLFAISYIALTVLIVIIIFPYLWQAPLDNFIIAFKNMSNFRWSANVLFFGRYINATNLPWYYIPGWILITTPLLYSIFMLIGTATIFKQLFTDIRKYFANKTNFIELMMLLTFILPLSAVIAKSSTLYDGWRHMYFLYIPFILLAVKGVHSLVQINKRALTLAIAYLLLLNFSYYTSWIIKAHPMQNVYFNFLVGSDLKNKFDLDYWGLGNRDALQYILDNDHRQKISVKAVSTTPLEYSLFFLDKNQREKLIIHDKEEEFPDYLFTNYRQMTVVDYDGKFDGKYKLFYRKVVDGEVIISVYKAIEQ